MGKNLDNIVISAINFSEGGPLSLLKDCLSCLYDNFSDKYNIIALVHKKDLIRIPNIECYEFSDSKRSWLKRLYYEYIYFKKLSKKIKPHLWLSLHDITPNVEADILAVYCHNPAPFYKIPFRSIFLEPKFFLFNLFYKYLYQLNLKKNTYVVVQQEQTREAFRGLFNINNIIVSYPQVNFKSLSLTSSPGNAKYRFFYPALPRVFKNFEVICKATQHLNDRKIDNFEVFLTINGRETRYSKFIYDRYSRLPSLRFIGLQTRERIFELYRKSDCLIFPSKLETWGLPITEFKNFKKPILLADLEYAHETIGDYDKVRFFDPDNFLQLSELMSKTVKCEVAFEKTMAKPVAQPFASEWKELFYLLLVRHNRVKDKMPYANKLLNAAAT